MRIIFLVRKRKDAGTAMHNAARFDGQRLANEGHDVSIVELTEGEPFTDLDRQKIYSEMDSRKGGTKWLPK